MMKQVRTKRSLKWRLSGVLPLFLLLAACDILYEPPVLPPTEAPAMIVTQVPATPQPTPDVSEVSVTETPLPDEQPAAPQCAYVWNVRPEPEIGAEVQAALREAGLVGVTVSAEAYGENCLDMITKQVLGFTVLQTDFRVQAVVLDLTDDEALGNWAAALLSGLNSFPRSAFPGPNRGIVFLQLSSGDSQRSWRINLREADQALAEGLRGAALLQTFEAAP